MHNQGICVILNQGSGKRDAVSTPEAVRAAFATNDADVTFKVIHKGTHLQRETHNALNEGFKTIVAAGGDGTICAVASALSGSDAIMGILPLGTFNYFARSLDLPVNDVVAAAKVIVGGKTMPLRVAKVNDRVFLNNASLGAYPAILETREAVYKQWGRSRVAAYWAVIKTLATVRPPMRLKLTIDGKSRDIRSPLVFVVNNAYQLQQMSLEGADRIEAGELVVFVAPDSTRLGMIRHATAVALGLATAKRNFELLSGKKLVITSLDRPASSRRTVARDGERERLAGPFKFEVIPDALQVLVPADRTAQVR